MKRLLTCAFILAVTLNAHCRIMRSWTYQELFDASNLVVIGRAVATTPTAERMTLPDIRPEIPVIGVSSEVEVRLVMKGQADGRPVILHHYQFEDPGVPERFMMAPALVSFDPGEHKRFLMFLRREDDGRHAPTAGQTDPAMFSVLRVESGVD